MATNTAAAAAAAAAAAREAARRAAELAAKKAAEEAARKAAQAAAQKAASNAQKTAAEAAAKKAAKAAADKAAQEISARAGQRPTASSVRQAFGKDELSKGLGQALRRRATDGLGMPAVTGPAPTGRTASLSEMRAIQAKGGSIESFRSPDSIDRSKQAQAAAAPKTPEERAAQGARDVQKAYDDAHNSGKSDAIAANAASQKLRELTQGSHDVAYNNALIRASAPTLDKITTVIAKNAGDDGFTDGDDKEAVKNSIRALADTATASGAIGSFMIADPLAKKIPDESELMHVDDAFYEHHDAGGKDDLMAALSSRLQAYGKDDANDELMDRHEGGFSLGGLWDATGGKLVSAAGDLVGAVGDGLGAVTGFVGDAADGVMKVVGKAGDMAVDVAKGTVELAGDAASWTAEQVSDAAEFAAKNGMKLAGAALNWVGDHARELAAEALDVDGQMAKLNSPGDTVTMAVGGKIGATVLQGGAEVEMKVTKTEDGYEMSLTGKLSGGVFGGLSLPGFPSAEGEANATGIANATMKFKTLDEVTQAAETVGGIGIATAVGGPAGALLTGATAGDEIRDITDHFQSGSVGLELSAEAKASLGETAGIGAGGSVSGAVTTGARLEITKGQPPALVLEQGIEAKGSLALGAPVSIPSLGGKLNGGSLDGQATVSAETRIPLPSGMSLSDVVSDPVGSIKKVGQNVLDNTTTKLTLGVDVSGGAALEGVGISGKGGLEVELSGEAKTKDLAGALGQAMRGDLNGALTTLGTKTNLSVDVNRYTQSDLINIDEEISVPGFTIGVHAQDSIRDETDVWSFEGTPAELAKQGFDLFKNLNMNVS